MTTLRFSKHLLVTAVLAAGPLTGLGVGRVEAQPQAALVPTAPTSWRLTLDEARQRVLADSNLLKLAALNVQSKEHATGAARSDYFPKIIGNSVYLRFTDPLGSVITTQGRPLLGIAPKTLAANVLNQNTSFTSVNVLQPITDLLKVRQGVRIAKADEQIAQAQLEKGARELLAGVDQLYWGLLAVYHIRAVVLEGYQGAEQFARLGTTEARVLLLEAKQGLQQIDVQGADLQEQLNLLLGLPPHTVLELIEPPLPGSPVACADDAVRLALAASPDVREAAQNISKADAATCAARLDYVPSIALMGGFTNQTGASYIQQNFGYIGAVASYTFVDWGKRRHTVLEREHMIGMAALKLRQTQDDVRQKALKAYRGLGESYEALTVAQELASLRREAEAKAFTTARANPSGLVEASKARGTADVDALKANLAYRQAHAELSRLIGQ